MAKSKPKERCFIIMPITTPANLVEKYKGDRDHFDHVLHHLFIPALEDAGFEAIPPKSTGSDVIQAEIIKQLSECELVLCDMSILNPNVFFEFGIRTAIDKPVALVVDDLKTIPFDPGIINCHPYSHLEVHTLEKEKKALTKHVQEAHKKSKGRNTLWKYFGVAQPGMFKPEDAELGEKMDLIVKKLSAIEEEKRLSLPHLLGQEDATGFGGILSKELQFNPISQVAEADKINRGRHLRLQEWLNNVMLEQNESLTGAEKSVLRMILQGKSNQEMAKSMNRSRRTVEAHRSRLMKKLDLDAGENER